MTDPTENQLISSALLKWISLLTSNQIRSFTQLSTGEFYLDLLSSVKQFKLIRPINTHASEETNTLSLASRVSNIRTIGESVVRYYQTNLMKDISQMKINYFELCMEHCEQSIKLFSLVVGIFVEENGPVLKKFEHAVEKLKDPNDQYIVKALLENTKTIGEPIVKNQEISLKKEMLLQLESYQNKIEVLELDNIDLRIQLEEEKQIRESLETEVKQLKAEKSKILQKSDVIEIMISRLETDKSSLSIENENLQKKIDSQKRHYDQLISKNQEKMNSLQKEIQLIDSMKLKIDELKGINSELRDQLNEKVESYKIEEKKFTLMKENYKDLQENLQKAQTKLSEVELEYQEFRFKFEYQSSMKPKIKQSPSYRLSNNSQLSSFKYRVRDRLDSEMKDELSQYHMRSSIMGRKDSREKTSRATELNNKNMTSINDANPGDIFQHNFSNYVINEIGNPNIRDIEDVGEFYQGENNVQEKSAIKVREFNHLPVLENQQLQREQKEIIEDEEKIALRQKVTDLKSQNQILKHELRKYAGLRKKQQNLDEEFKKKLAKVKEIEPLYNTDWVFEVSKENSDMGNSEKSKNYGKPGKENDKCQSPFNQLTLN